MQDVTTSRRFNFQQLVKDLGGPREAAIKLDMNESQISQLISPNIGKAMGEGLARRIEKAAGMEDRFLDMPASPDGRRMRFAALLSPEEFPGKRPAKPKSGAAPFIVWDNSNRYEPRGQLRAVYCPDSALGAAAEEGDLLVFDCWPLAVKGPPAIRPGSIVAFAHEGRAAFRFLRQTHGGGIELFSPDSLYAPIQMPDTAAIIGVLVEVRHMKPRLRN